MPPFLEYKRRYILPPFSEYKRRYILAKLNGGTSQNTVFIVTAIAVLYFAQSTVLVTNFNFLVISHSFLFLQCCLLRRLLAFDMENYKTG
jgi:hypothetical protein